VKFTALASLGELQAPVHRELDKALVALKDATMLERDAEDALAAVRSERELAKFDREVDLADELPPQPAEAAGCPVHSFLADTPVRLAGGGSKPIAKVKAGDTVLATDPQTGVTKPEKVQRVIVTHTDRDFTDLAVHSDRQPNAPPQKLTTTWHHPFWDVTHHRWTDARALTAGTVLRQPDGTTATVTAVRSYHRRATTYDLTVTDLHSYYVLAGATPVLVHNCGGSVPRHRSVCDCANGGRPQMMRGPKPAGTGPHNLKIAEVADQVSDGEVIAGGARLPEREFATPGGFKGSRRPDILVQRADGSLYGINVGKQSMRSGAPIKREAEALQDLEGIGIEMHFVAYN
jgi:hypothetical protein